MYFEGYQFNFDARFFSIFYRKMWSCIFLKLEKFLFVFQFDSFLQKSHCKEK